MTGTLAGHRSVAGVVLDLPAPGRGLGPQLASLQNKETLKLF